MIAWLQDAAIRYAVLLVIMALDIISGVIKTKVNGQAFSSAKMASGLYKKAGTMLVMVLSDILYFIAPRYLEINIEIQIWVFLYAIAMEIISISENVTEGRMKELFKRISDLMYSEGGDDNGNGDIGDGDIND